MTMSIITMRSRLYTTPQTLRPFVYVLQNLDRNFATCGATYRRICEMFSALQSISGPVTDVENSVQIDA